MDKTKEKTKTLEEILAENNIKSEPEHTHKLILWNDEVNSFENVILSLVTIMNFSPMKAEQTAWRVHTEGADVIKTGSKDELKPVKVALEERGLTLTIEKD